MMDAIRNMDQLAAKFSQQIVSETVKEKKGKEKEDIANDLDNMVTKTLGVLQEQGVYAVMLFLFSRTSDKANSAHVIRSKLIAMLTELKDVRAFLDAAALNPKDDKEVLKFYIDKVMDDLDTLFLVRDLYEQTLIYARFGAKAAEKGK